MLKKGVLKNFAKSTGKRLCRSLSFNKVAGLRSAASLKKRLWHRCFSVNFAKSLRTPMYRTHLDDCFSGRLLLKFQTYIYIYFKYISRVKIKRRSKVQEKNMSCERAWNFDQSKTFSEIYKPMIVWLWLVYKFNKL